VFWGGGGGGAWGQRCRGRLWMRRRGGQGVWTAPNGSKVRVRFALRWGRDGGGGGRGGRGGLDPPPEHQCEPVARPLAPHLPRVAASSAARAARLNGAPMGPGGACASPCPRCGGDSSHSSTSNVRLRPRAAALTPPAAPVPACAGSLPPAGAPRPAPRRAADAAGLPATARAASTPAPWTSAAARERDGW